MAFFEQFAEFNTAPASDDPEQDSDDGMIIKIIHKLVKFSFITNVFV